MEDGGVYSSIEGTAQGANQPKAHGPQELN